MPIIIVIFTLLFDITLMFAIFYFMLSNYFMVSRVSLILFVFITCLALNFLILRFFLVLPT